MVGKQSKFLVWINYRVRITTQDSRIMIGTFIAFDKHMNVVLSETEEYIKIKAKKQGDIDREKKRTLGLVLVRGDNIISLSAESPPSQNIKKITTSEKVPGQTSALGRGEKIEAQAGLSGPGRGVGISSNSTMNPSLGRGVLNTNSVEIN